MLMELKSTNGHNDQLEIYQDSYHQKTGIRREITFWVPQSRQNNLFEPDIRNKTKRT